MAVRWVSISTDWCHICGLLIPIDVVSETHPLFGTVDHVIPLASGGSNSLENRRAAHRYCNTVKADGPLEQMDRYGMQGRIKSILKRHGVTVTRTMLRNARERIGLNAATNHGKGKHHRLPLSIQQWDNEGGYVGRRSAHYDEQSSIG